MKHGHLNLILNFADIVVESWPAPINIRGVGLKQSDIKIYYDFEFEEFVFRGQILISELQESVWFAQFSQRQRIGIERRRRTLAERNRLRRDEARADRENEARNQFQQVQAGLVLGRLKSRRALPLEELEEREAQLAADRARYEELRAEQEQAFQNRMRQRQGQAGTAADGGQSGGEHQPIGRTVKFRN